MIRSISFLFLFFFINLNLFCQFDFEGQIVKKEYTKDIVDPTYGITLYEPLNIYLHSDSTRIEEGYAINGWREDKYTNGNLLHKGYYIDGQLKVYKNFYPNGNIERNFKAIDTFRSKLTLYYSNGNIKSKISYSGDFPMEWIDYYENGNISYYEKFNNDKLTHSSKVFYFENGEKQEELVINNKKKKLYLKTEYFQDGNIKLKGHLKYDKVKYDYVKYGTWHHYDENGGNHKKDSY